MMKHTPLFDIHKKAGAKLVGFSGWEMPLSYSGVLEEHRTVRHKVGLFDVSHMGRIWVEGSGALPFLQQVTTNNVEGLSKGYAHYSLVLNPEGGILDDIFVYSQGEERFLLCVNGSNREKIARWLKGHMQDFKVSVEDRTMETGLLALQGPFAEKVLKKIIHEKDNFLPTKLHSFGIGNIKEVEVLVARTGYTGELGYEFFLAAKDLPKLWKSLISAGKDEEIQPVGLGARDTLRLEKGYCLYGHEIDEKTNPVEAGLRWVVSMDKGDFIGRDALLKIEEKKIQKKLIGFQLLQGGVPRQGCILFSEGKEIGIVTSGNHSPTLGKGIGMGYVLTNFSEPGEDILVEVRGKAIPSEIVEIPFYRKKNKGHKK